MSGYLIVWFATNVGAAIVLAVLSYFSSRWALEGLDWFERALYRWEYHHDRGSPPG